jgi:hypothetical protein
VHFFKLQRAANATSQEVWNRIVADGTVALRFPASEAGTFQKITLYMIYAE